MSEFSLPSNFPDFTRPIPIPERDAEGVDLSILGLNEVVGPRKNGGVRAVTGQITDLAVRGHLAIIETSDGEGPPQYSLRQSGDTESAANLHVEESELLALLFQKRNKQTVSLEELAYDRTFLPHVHELQRQTRKRLTRGEQYIGISSVVAQRLQPVLILAGLGMAGAAAYNHNLPLGIVGGVMAAVEAFDPVGEVLEKTGRQMLGQLAIMQYDKLLGAARKHVDNNQAIVSFLQKDDHRTALASKLAESGVIRSYERTLGYLKILKHPGVARTWAMELAYLYNAVPSWFSSRELQTNEPYDADTMAIFLMEFLAQMDAAIGKRDK